MEPLYNHFQTFHIAIDVLSDVYLLPVGYDFKVPMDFNIATPHARESCRIVRVVTTQLLLLLHNWQWSVVLLM
jgi:hypothetical protein